MSETTETKIETPPATAPEITPPPAPEATAPAPAADNDPAITDDYFRPETVFERAKKAFAELGRAFSGRPQREGWELSCWQLLDMSGEKIISAGDLEKLRALQARHDAARQAMLTHGTDRARAAWLAQGAALPAVVGQGTVGNHGQIFSEQDILDRYAHIQQAARDEQRRVYIECLGLCQFVADRFCAVANGMISTMEKREQQQHARFGIQPTRQSELIVALKKALAIADVRTNETPGGNLGPRDLLPYLNI